LPPKNVNKSFGTFGPKITKPSLEFVSKYFAKYGSKYGMGKSGKNPDIGNIIYF
jgi:hypothetical protein